MMARESGAGTSETSANVASAMLEADRRDIAPSSTISCRIIRRIHALGHAPGTLPFAFGHGAGGIFSKAEQLIWQPRL